MFVNDHVYVTKGIRICSKGNGALNHMNTRKPRLMSDRPLFSLSLAGKVKGEKGHQRPLALHLDRWTAAAAARQRCTTNMHASTSFPFFTDRRPSTRLHSITTLLLQYNTTPTLFYLLHGFLATYYIVILSTLRFHN